MSFHEDCFSGNSQLKYCGLLNFRGVPIFVEFTIQEKKNENAIFCMNYAGKCYGDKFWTPQMCNFLLYPRKLVPTKIKPSTINKFVILSFHAIFLSLLQGKNFLFSHVILNYKVITYCTSLRGGGGLLDYLHGHCQLLYHQLSLHPHPHLYSQRFPCKFLEFPLQFSVKLIYNIIKCYFSLHAYGTIQHHEHTVVAAFWRMHVSPAKHTCSYA